MENSPQIPPEVYKLIPCSMIPLYSCSVMYDGYPRDNKNIDVTICLHDGRVMEFFKRECVSSITLPDVLHLTEIKIIRDYSGELFYLVWADGEIIILSSKNQLSVHRKFRNVMHYEVCDPECSGEPKLKLITKLSSLYISFSDFNVCQGDNKKEEHVKPVITTLEKKLTEAKYNLACNEKSYKQLEKLRQYASFSCHRDGALQLTTSKPIIRFCNKNIVIQLEVKNISDNSLNKVCLLIHNNGCNSLSYTSKVYEHLSTSPFYKEIEFREIQSNQMVSIVAVIPIKEFKSTISNRIDFSMIVSYKCQENDYLKSFDDVNISAADVMGKNFDVFNSPGLDEHSICLAMISTTHKTVLCLKQNALEDPISLPTIFSKYLEMDLLGETNMLAIHKKSPHHILHGTMISFDKKKMDSINNEITFNIDVYTRSPSQVLALIHFIYDRVPHALIVTTPAIQVSSNPEMLVNTGPPKFNYYECALSLINQSKLTLKYLDDCLTEMNKSNIVGKTDIKIDVFAMGQEEFVKYRNNMLKEAKNGIEHIVKSLMQRCDTEDHMEVD